MEMQRRRSEKITQAYNTREKMQASEEQEVLKKGCEFEKNWSEDDRRDKRIGIIIIYLIIFKFIYLMNIYLYSLI